MKYFVVNCQKTNYFYVYDENSIFHRSISKLNIFNSLNEAFHELFSLDSYDEIIGWKECRDKLGEVIADRHFYNLAGTVDQDKKDKQKYFIMAGAVALVLFLFFKK